MLVSPSSSGSINHQSLPPSQYSITFLFQYVYLRYLLSQCVICLLIMLTSIQLLPFACHACHAYLELFENLKFVFLMFSSDVYYRIFPSLPDQNSSFPVCSHTFVTCHGLARKRDYVERLSVCVVCVCSCVQAWQVK